jgi:uncharacterized protein (TIGR02001 family)
MIKKTTLALAALVAGVSAQAQEEANSLSATLDVTYVTDYVFRGQRLAEASVQPSFELGYAGAYAGVWHSDDISGDYNEVLGVDSETDLYAGYGFDVTDTISLDALVTRYTYSGGSADDSTEIGLGASLDVLLTPTVYAYWDFDYEIFTAEAAVGYSFPVEAANISIDLSGKIGYRSIDDVPFGLPDDYTYFVAGVSVPYALAENATISVGVDYIYNTEEELSAFKIGTDSLGNPVSDENDIIVAKVSVTFGF